MTQQPKVTINIRIRDVTHELTIDELQELRDTLNRLLPPEPWRVIEQGPIEHIPQDWHPPDSIYCESTDKIMLRNGTLTFEDS